MIICADCIHNHAKDAGSRYVCNVGKFPTYPHVLSVHPKCHLKTNKVKPVKVRKHKIRKKRRKK